MRLARENEFDRIFAIMEQSFPKDEYRSRAGQRAIWADDRYRVYVEEKGEEICAFISVWQLQGIVFAEHFAVDAKFRGRGLGAEMLSKLQSVCADPICLEVELPETEMARRRIAFYERNGFFYNDYPYEQPAFSKEQSPVPLRIMTTASPLNPSEFNALKKIIYKEIYRRN